METTTRIHGLDAVRGGALLLGVLLHATMSFLPGPPLWPVADAARSTTLSVTFFVIHIMRMAVFFLIAGFFGRMLVERKGVKAFVADRACRIGVPLIVGWPIMLSAILVISTLAASGRLVRPSLPPLSPTSVPLTHLWFLYVLFLLYAAMVTVRVIASRLDHTGWMGVALDAVSRRLFGWWTAMALAVPTAAALYLHPYWFMWFGVPTPDRSLYPNRAALVAYGLAFALGWISQRQAATVLPRWRCGWPWQLALGAGATAACLAMVGPEPLLAPAPQGLRKLSFAVAYAVALWSLTFAALGLGLRFLDGHSPWRRYLADASYWIYLAHLPLVMALQWTVADWPLPWPVKLIAVLAVAMGLLLVTYDILVRPTYVGALLNGRRYPPAVLRSPSSRTATAMRTYLLLLLVLPGALHAQTPTPPEALPLDTVLARYGAAVGPVHTLQTRRTALRVLGMAPFEIPVLIEAKRPDLIRKEVTIQGAVQITAYDGADAWRIDPFVPGGRRPMDVPAAEIPDLIEEADFDGVLINAAAKGHRVRYAGPGVVTIGGRRVPVHSLAVIRADSRESVIHLDARSYLEVQRVDRRPMAGRDLEITITPSDYRSVQGIAIPYAIEIAPEGLPTPIRVVVDRVEFGVPLDGQRFSRRGAR
jgi:glucans biosynthesis protein C